MKALNDSSALLVGSILSGTRSFMAEDVEIFCRVTHDRNPLHHDAEYAAQTKFGQLIVPGLLVASIFTDILSDWDLIAHTIEFQFVSPVFIGESLRARIEVTGRDEVWLSGNIECVASDQRIVLKGRIKGVSHRAVLSAPTLTRGQS